VAKKQHAQVVSVLESIEALPPGLYGMQIHERKGKNGQSEYEVEFHERRLEDIVAKLNRFERADEKPFEAVAAVSDFNQRAYELFARPLIQSMSNDLSAKLTREFNPLRVQRWGMSDNNPWLSWLPAVAQGVKAHRAAVDADNVARKSEKTISDLVSASLDYYRGMRDALSEAAFFQTYGAMFPLQLADAHEAEERCAKSVAPRELPFVQDALTSIAEGGYTEALARVAFLLSRKGEPLPLSRLSMRQEVLQDYAEFLPTLMIDQWRRIRGEQEIIAHYEPERAIETLPQLLADQADRERLLTLLKKILADERVQKAKPTAEQMAMYERIRKILESASARPRRVASIKRA